MVKDPDRVEKNLRNSIFEYAEKVEIQSQLAEAFHIWKNDSYSITEFRDEDDIDDETFAKFFDWFIFDFKTFNNQKRVVEEFHNDNSENLNSDEASVLSDWKRSYLSYFEVIDINRGESCLIKDIFTDEQLLVHDRAVSEKINIFDVISARPLKTGEKYFFSGIISVFPNMFKQLISEFFIKEYGHYISENDSKPSIPQYLKDHGYLIGNYVEDLVNHPQLISEEGEEFVIAASEYDIKEKIPVLNILDESKELLMMDGSRDGNEFYFIEKIDDKSVDAYIEIRDESILITCNTATKLSITKSFFESILGTYISYKKDNVKKLNSFIEEPRNTSYKLPKGFRSRKKFENSLDDYYSAWIDQPIEALGGSTPRDAMKTSEGRILLEQILIELEKLYESARKAGEPYYEVSKLREILQNSLN